MEKAKSKKKLIAIIAGAAMAFVLTVVVSVAATLAYFGDQKTTGDATITMGQALTFVDSSVTAQASVANVLPGSTGNLTISGQIAQTTTTAYVRLKINVSGDNTNILTLGDNVAEASTSSLGTFVKHTDNYYYLAKTGTTTDMQAVNASTAATTVSVVLPYTVDATLTSSDVTPGGVLTVNATMEIIQSENLGTTVDAVATTWSTATVG